jgi:predicted amidohydrolase YtcJ
MDRAKALVKLPPQGGERMSVDALLAEHKRLNAFGLTSIRYPGATLGQYRILQEMRRRGLLTIRVTQLMRSPNATTAEEMAAGIAAWNLKPDEGDEWLRIGGIKFGRRTIYISLARVW